MKHSLWLSLAAASLMACTAPHTDAPSTLAQQSTAQVAPLPLSEAPEPRYRGWTRQAFYVPMADGVQLAATVYFPNTQSQTPTKLPALLWYMPGHRESIDRQTGTIRTAFNPQDIDFFTSHGYALVAAEMRGSGASFGYRELDRGPQIGRDGKSLVEWIASQSWSSGAVGMVGRSYQGFSQYATAAERPKGLKAIFPEIAGFDDYTSMFYPGGILVEALSAVAAGSIAKDDLNIYDPEDRRSRWPSMPVVDEDGDGEWLDEIPLDQNGDGAFLDDVPPQYADGHARDDIYYRATQAHTDNANLTLDKLRQARHRDSLIDDTPYSYEHIDPSFKPEQLAQSGIAVYHRGGWFDYHARDTVMWQATLAGLTPTRLMMAPTAHGGLPNNHSLDYRSGPYFDFFGDTQSSEQQLNVERLRFFDHYLRQLDNGFDREPPVALYVMGHGWRREAQWPLAREQRQRWYPAPHGRLAQAPETGAVAYTVDLNADSRWQGANRWNYRLASARAVSEVGADNGRRLSFDLPPLSRDLEVTGHPIVQLQLSSSAAEGDVYVYLEDVAPDGRVLQVTEGQLRANYAALVPLQQMVANPQSAPALRPDLPWHGYRKSDYQPRPFADGKVVSLTLDLMPTAWLFKAGHRVRVSITGADYPSFEHHPELSLEDGKAPTYTLMLGADTWVDLPVIPNPETH